MDNEEKYYCITNTDGDTLVTEYDKEKLIKEISFRDNPEFFDKLPKETNTNYWEGKQLIIKGKIITPKPIDVIKSYTLE